MTNDPRQRAAEYRQRVRRVADALPRPVTAVVLDFDGVLTDNGVYFDETGRVLARCDRTDGLGVTFVRDAGVPILILSKTANRIVSQRAGMLGIDVLSGIDDKAPTLCAWAGERGIDLAGVVYCGNDTNDVGVMRVVGCATAPSDAHADALEVAHIVLDFPGGRGAVRQLTDAVLLAR